MNYSSRLLFSPKGVVLGLLLLASAAILGQGCPPAAPPPDPNSGLTGEYVGSERCFTCHSRTHNEWVETRHHESYNTLVALGQENNEVCLTCHTTGFQQPGGFQSINTTELLANVGCEACHGPARGHVQDVTNRALRPAVSMSADWCARCHNGFHHDTYSEWAASGHGRVDEHVAEGLSGGSQAQSCGVCHSGDVLLAKNFNQNIAVSDALLSGVPIDQINGTSCSVCHDPHRNTGNAVLPPPGHDFQLRWPEVTHPEPTNTVAETTNPARFNLCGQCHHERGATWTSNARPPHHSIQANFFVGEMPAPEGQPPLVPNQRSTHRFVQKQCVTCHMQHEAHLTPGLGAQDATVSGEMGELTHVGHTFSISSLSGCVGSGCHPSEAVAQADTERFQAEVQSRLDAIIARLGPVSTWGFSSAGELPLGGPPANQQNAIPEPIRKARWLWTWVAYDGSLGVHNPPYTRAILTEAERLLTEAGL
ncbi:MAG TPA: multiheme c-type cytochrome [Phycisphaerae bacterium]|jgi:hypothetical protein|nr:hypothetical protein [Phycisphaerae bacterium]HOB75464.1 multiheme c-type cytochrome [Phycisphaerae bacterium]HOJ55312.1 multiheme c-type cytochrome [Phycisphaerae bacterium]HOL27400.1 multiheme c-type cytochrome [Phycisphaerae bacterium]HPP21615.1 multiheme c-type cytochrome [Phycisphaerae bacterium]